MKCIAVKRLIYYAPYTGEIMFGAEEYDIHLTDENILGAFHEVGKTAWINNSLWILRAGIPVYQITVEKFYQPKKR